MQSGVEVTGSPDVFMPQTTGTCEYGHTAANGNCDVPCSGTRFDPCRCETQAEAEDGNRNKGLWPGLVVSVLVLAGTVFFAFKSKSMRRIHAVFLNRQDMSHLQPEEQQAAGIAFNTPQSTPTETQASSAQPTPMVVQAVVVGGGAQPVEAAPIQATVVGVAPVGAAEQNPNENNNVQDPEKPTSDISGMLSSDQPQKSTSRLEIAQQKSADFAKNNRSMASMIRIVCPLVFVGFAIYQCVTSFTAARPFYEKFSNFTGAMVGLGLLLSLAFIIAWRFQRFGSNLFKFNPGDDPIGLSLLYVPVGLVITALTVGSAGLIWSLIMLVSPGSIYHWDCGEWEDYH